MDELELSGRRYISTRRAGKEHGYHSDYIGQLIRGKKVVGQKVGRAWYVDEESLATYLGKTYTPPPTAAPAAEASSSVTIEHKVEETTEPVAPSPATTIPVHKEVPFQPLASAEPQEEYMVPIHTEAPKSPQVAPTPARVGGLTYVADDEPMLPVVNRMPTEAYAHESLIPPQMSKRGFNIKGAALVGIAALVIVGAGVAASIYLGVTVRVVDGQSATVFYSVKN